MGRNALKANLAVEKLPYRHIEKRLRRLKLGLIMEIESFRLVDLGADQPDPVIASEVFDCTFSGVGYSGEEAAQDALSKAVESESLGDEASASIENAIAVFDANACRGIAEDEPEFRVDLYIRWT
jgi:hypothetical protein